jgi:hypothetical protein
MPDMIWMGSHHFSTGSFGTRTFYPGEYDQISREYANNNIERWITEWRRQDFFDRYWDDQMEASDEIYRANQEDYFNNYFTPKLREEHDFKLRKYSEAGLIDDPENENTIKLVNYLLARNSFKDVLTKLDEMGFYETYDWFVEKYDSEIEDEAFNEKDEGFELIDKEILNIAGAIKHL